MVHEADGAGQPAVRQVEQCRRDSPDLLRLCIELIGSNFREARRSPQCGGFSLDEAQDVDDVRPLLCKGVDDRAESERFIVGVGGDGKDAVPVGQVRCSAHVSVIPPGYAGCVENDGAPLASMIAEAAVHAEAARWRIGLDLAVDRGAGRDSVA